MKLRQKWLAGAKVLRSVKTNGSLEARVIAHLRSSNGLTTSDLVDRIGGDKMLIIFALHKFLLDKKITCQEGLNSFLYKAKQ